ncbi:hypothetical protein ACFXKD_27715 [Nocardiopsis aegyptia]|uniref:zinc finger domain-containing protein n=1 Tax=Nocardiopsis aegyptia TaxID=220378 RepID=UPI00366F3DC0
MTAAVRTFPRPSARVEDVYLPGDVPPPARSRQEHTAVTTTDEAARALPATAVPCPRCGAEAGAPCTSHGGTRVRKHDVHQARTAAHAQQVAAQHDDQAAWAYIREVAHRLALEGVDVTDYWAQEDDDHHEGLIVIGDQAQAFGWHDEQGWRHLTGPRTDFGPYNNATDLDLAVDADVPDVVAAVLSALGADDPAGTERIPI